MPTGTYASVVVGTTIFSTYDGVSPYPNLAAIHPHPENSLVDDYVNWHVSLHLAGQGEAAWNMGATFPPDANLKKYRVRVVVPDLKGVVAAGTGSVQ